MSAPATLNDVANKVCDDVLNSLPEPAAELIEQLPVGIHFGVPDEIYFAQTALGSSDRKALAIDPVEWQFNRLHGEDTDTKAKIWGSALHSRVLEGEQEYRDRYGVLPDSTTINGLLDTVADLKAWLDNEGAEYKRSAAKPELIALVQALDPEVPIWERITSAFQEKYPEHRRLTAEMATGIEIAAQWLQSNKKLASFMDGGTFRFGAPEVTIIYEVAGVRLRARFDYVLPGVLIDLKSYRPWKNTGEPVRAVTQAIGNFRYDLQAAAYFEAFENARELWLSGKVFGSEPYGDFLKMVFERTDPPTWLWIMVKGDGAPRPRLVEFPRELTVFQTAQIQIGTALSNYRQMLDQYGPDADWQPDDDVIVLANEDFPNWFGIN